MIYKQKDLSLSTALIEKCHLLCCLCSAHIKLLLFLVFNTTAQLSCDSQSGWSDKMGGNISQHRVAGQNAIRDKDAEHNWV